jgi:hypothetical protein
MAEAYCRLRSAEAGESTRMSEQPEKERDEDVELDEQNGELLPDREVMSIIDPSGASTGGLGPPVLDDLE